MGLRLVRTFACCLLFSALPGCLGMQVHLSGIPYRVPETRTLVHRQFGPPETFSTTTLVNRDTGETRQFDVEHYRVHRKFAPRYGPGLYLPFPGFDLLFVLPVSLYAAASEIIKGHTLEFVYSDDGRTIGTRYPIGLMSESPSLPAEREYRSGWYEATEDGTVPPEQRTGMTAFKSP